MDEGAAPDRRVLKWMAAVAAVLGLGAGAMFFALSPRYLPEPPDRGGSAPAPAPAEVAEAPPEAEPDMAAAEAVEAEVPEEAGDARPSGMAAPAPPSAPAVPGVDVVRVAPDGRALVAGTAEPGARVTIMADNRQVGVAEADSSGDFVAIFTAEPSAEPQSLTLEAEDAEGGVTRSEDVVLLLPEAGEAEPDAVAAPAADDGDAGAEAVAGAPAGNEAPPSADGPPEEIAAVAVVRRDGLETMPLARPVGADPRDVALASISYGETGDVALSGFGTAGVILRAYVDEGFAREAVVDADGRWEIALGDVDQGLYTLRIDAVDAEGRVESRLETPFQRDMPRARPGAEPGSVVVVQPGTNLWTLARIHYGSGVLYTQIFTANRELIRDPNLIYPGQIFALPEAGPEN